MNTDKKNRGYIQVYTGNGKGKTTASIGVAMRSVGEGRKVYFGQFLKDKYVNEHKIFDRLGVKHDFFGTGRFIKGKPTAEDIALARKGFDIVSGIIKSGEYDLVVLDELNNAVAMGLIPIDDVLSLLDSKPEKLEIIITGRNADAKLIERADLVTEMTLIKHYYNAGVPARAGIEE